MGVTVGVILEEIQALYKQYHQPCFLYLSSEIIKVWFVFLGFLSFLAYFCSALSNFFCTFQIFGSDASCASYLKVLIETLFSQTTCLLTRIQNFTSQPDIADDCFLLASRCIRYCPQLFFPSPIFPPLVDCSMVGITVQHRSTLSLSLPLLTCGRYRNSDLSCYFLFPGRLPIPY